MRRMECLAVALCAAISAAGAQQSPSGGVTLTATVHESEVLLELGPMDIPSESGHDMHMPEAPPLWALVPASGWMHGYSVDMVDQDGNTVPQSYLHHVNVIATQRRELFSGIMLRLAAAGPETHAVSLPRFLGYEAHEGDTLLVRTMFRPGPRAWKGVRVRVHFPFTPQGALLGALTISPMYLDVTPPAGGHAFDLPPGHSERFWEASPAIAGRILGLSGHVHKYATLFRFEDRTAHKVLWEVRPDTTADGDAKQIPVKRFLATLGLGIRTDHVYRFTVTYDNPTGETIMDGGMGTLGGVFRPARGVAWPPIDPADKDYQLDLWAMWTP